MWVNVTGTSTDIFGAKVSTGGAVLDTFLFVNQQGFQLSPAITHGPGNQMLVTYSGWTDYINNHPANTMRIWGKFLPQVGIEEQPTLTTQHSLFKIYPNPFRCKATIKFEIRNPKSETNSKLQNSKSQNILRIYDATGRLVKSFPLATRYSLLATSSIEWDGDDDQGKVLPAGVYFCRLEADDFKTTKKIVKLR